MTARLQAAGTGGVLKSGGIARSDAVSSSEGFEKSELAARSPPVPVDEEATPPCGPSQNGALQRWNEPRINAVRYLSTLFSFIIMGMNDGCIGALIPYLEDYYGVSYTIISLVFLAPWGGYLAAALSNNLIHHYIGQRGVAMIGPLTRICGYVAVCVHPPFAALPCIMILPGYGSGLEDSAWNAWVGNMESANELLGFLHGAYGLGGTIGPLIATAMVTKGGLPWYTFYYLMVGLAMVELLWATTAFWGATGEVYRAVALSQTGGMRTTTRTVLKSPIVWLVAVFLLGYVGVEVSLGGWIVSFMLEVRNAEPFPAGLAVTFFWLGLALGRVVLGFVTGRIGEKLAITGYLLVSVVMHLLYWLIPNFAASAVFVAFEGFFLGPLFPAAIVAATKLLSSDYHVSAIGFAAAFGGGGAAIFPFVVGAIAQSQGVWVLQPIILALLVLIVFIWLLLPGGLRKGGLEHARETNERPGHQLRKASRWVFERTNVKRQD